MKNTMTPVHFNYPVCRAKRRTGLVVGMLLLGVAISSNARAVDVIISDAYDGRPNNTTVIGTFPVTNLPGGAYQTHNGGSTSNTVTGVGDPAPSLEFGVQGSTALAITDAGSYDKPAELTVSANLRVNDVTGLSSQKRGMYLGYYSGLGTQFTNNLFTGFALDSAGNLTLFQDTSTTGFNATSGVVGTVPYVGTFSASNFHQLQYTISTITGGVSNLSLEGSTADYSSLEVAGPYFSDLATGYLALAASSSTGSKVGQIDSVLLTTDFGTSPSSPTPISGVTVEDFSSQFSGREADDSINGSGFQGLAHNATATDMWLTNATATGDITYDLEGNYSLNSISVWNYNEATAGLFDRGANEVEILVSSTDNVADLMKVITTDTNGNFFFEQADGSSLYEGFELTFGNVTNSSLLNDVRLIQFNILSNHPGGDNFTGLSEVRFFGGAPFAAAATPEPSTFVLAALSLLGLMGTRRRRRNR